MYTIAYNIRKYIVRQRELCDFGDPCCESDGLWIACAWRCDGNFPMNYERQGFGAVRF
jgi:hypothetical protein